MHSLPYKKVNQLEKKYQWTCFNLKKKKMFLIDQSNKTLNKGEFKRENQNKSQEWAKCKKEFLDFPIRYHLLIGQIRSFFISSLYQTTLKGKKCLHIFILHYHLMIKNNSSPSLITLHFARAQGIVNSKSRKLLANIMKLIIKNFHH